MLLWSLIGRCAQTGFAGATTFPLRGYGYIVDDFTNRGMITVVMKQTDPQDLDLQAGSCSNSKIPEVAQ